MTDQIKLDESWKTQLASEFNKDYMRNLKAFLQQQKQQGKTIFPRGKEYFQALNLTPLEQVKLVILGQDPYHGPGQAHGLCFSVKPGVPTPPSLKNIYKEMAQDLAIEQPSHGCLLPWAQQGVLLLNAVLTVEQHKAGSHQGRGWELFTDKIIEILNRSHDGLVFLLWGSYAQKKGAAIDRNRHLVLQSPHPSPLSAHRGFFGNGHFSKANHYLEQQGKKPVNWLLPQISEIDFDGAL
ncbi:uracil-DNA glycosylase [Kiloniella laminariae]|uniref:Uracil-DNA glycosylase n=1 Tax=Kiloniella laminariae TaxID=454162 RepID=A0ABT4LDN8_9PROT|nr:uracil-DNA glycosylase [Kiloniella laminariae]MCZ4279223.1 uracil-DNA glycosylase [Kiloniella laminariae]